jgi:hypothetical protein
VTRMPPSVPSSNSFLSSGQSNPNGARIHWACRVRNRRRTGEIDPPPMMASRKPASGLGISAMPKITI